MSLHIYFFKRFIISILIVFKLRTNQNVQINNHFYGTRKSYSVLLEIQFLNKIKETIYILLKCIRGVLVRTHYKNFMYNIYCSLK